MRYEMKPPWVDAELWDGSEQSAAAIVRELEVEAVISESPDILLVTITMPMPGTLSVPVGCYVTKDGWGTVSYMPQAQFEAQYVKATGPST